MGNPVQCCAERGWKGVFCLAIRGGRQNKGSRVELIFDVHKCIKKNAKSTTINAPSGSGQANISKTISYARDTIGRITAITYPSGKVLGISYGTGADKRVSGYTLNGATLISSIQYFPLGGPESWLLGGTTKDYTRLIDLNGRIEKYTTPTGYRKLGFDNASRITSIGDYLGTSTTLNASQTFGYDNAGRLVTFSGFTSNGVNATTGLGNAAITQSQSFTYDNNGNRLSSTLNGTSSSYSYQAGSNKLASVSSGGGGISRSNTFDATGNLTSDGAQTYTYDDRGRLKTALASGTTTTYSINHQQLRVRKGSTAAPSDTRLFIYDEAGHMLGEYDQAGNAIQELIWLNDTPVAVTGTMPCLTSTSGSNGVPSCTENATAYIFTDHLNTPREVARINATTNTYVSLWKWDSLPFGETAANDNTASLGTFNFNHRFPGQYRDKETGLHQNWWREYDPLLGRYITSDPRGIRAGNNTYLYVGASPIIRSDFTGLWDLTPCQRDWMLSTYGPELSALFDSVNFQRGVDAFFEALDQSGITALQVLVASTATTSVGFMLRQYLNLVGSDILRTCGATLSALRSILGMSGSSSIPNISAIANAATASASAWTQAGTTVARVGNVFGLFGVAGSIAVMQARQACSAP